jgi:hypothetical protein
MKRRSVQPDNVVVIVRELVMIAFVARFRVRLKMAMDRGFVLIGVGLVEMLRSRKR